MRDDVESEFKLRAREPLQVAGVDAALDAAGAVCSRAGSRCQVDTYLDDASGSLARAGVALRVREAEGRRSVTCKERGEVEGGLHIRRELDAPWPRQSPPGSARDLPDGLRERISQHTEDRPLQPWLTLRVRRDVRVLADAGRDVCELAIDYVRASVDEREVEFQEVELEVLSDPAFSERLAHALRASLPVEFAASDKPTHAAAMLGAKRTRG